MSYLNILQAMGHLPGPEETQGKTYLCLGREWMGCWGNGMIIHSYIVDHSLIPYIVVPLSYKMIYNPH